ncbi:nucleoporin Nup107 [Schizosaccharomyces japonicus yFS275]|uniref:Nuclear pore complex protein n=1 Tax=Schizosaccharomyces japonicus (strain yFS275 / FY16936) TaxID=402676 RepID=B6K619_SCHJY|nr:nucleoporin Nup107 [Schizosaccharomyces japonicus yFS275]EEB08973.1 nucleoporin Nup107 [Schizosaccharomyces japonicus yFS275]
MSAFATSNMPVDGTSWQNNFANSSSSFTKMNENDELENVVTVGPNGAVMEIDLGDEFDLFAELVEKKGKDVFAEDGLLAAFYKACQEKIKQSTKENDTLAVEQWDLEMRTWDLVQRLYLLRSTGKVPVVPAHRFSSRAIWEEKFYSENIQASENNLVLNWLRDSASSPAAIELRGNRWFYTREAIKTRSRTISSFGEKSNVYVSSLDPDADLREEKRLEERDDDFENNFMQHLFWLFRSGEFEEMVELSKRSGNQWRAVSIQGMIEYRDSIVDSKLDTGTFGNKRKELWRRTCLALSREKKASTFERATYGALCGDLKSVLPVCKTWEDHLWAFYNCMTQHSVNLYLNSVMPSPQTRLPPIDSGAGLTPESIFQALAQSDSSEVKDAAAQPLRHVQARIICNNVRQLFMEFHEQLEAVRSGVKELDRTTEPHVLRVLVHLIYAIRFAGFEVDNYASDSILQAYIELLASAGKCELVPLYISNLSGHIRDETYARFLVLIEDEKQRLEQLKLAKKFSFNIDAAVNTAVERIFEETSTNVFSQNIELKSIDAPVDIESQRLIRTLEWMLITCQFTKLIGYSNAAYRLFLRDGNINAANLLDSRLPSETLVTNDMISQTPDTPENEAQLRVALEFMSYSSLCSAFFNYHEYSKLLNTLVHNQSAEEIKLSVLLKNNEDLKKLASDCISCFSELIRTNWLHPSTFSLTKEDNGDVYDQLIHIRNIFIPEIVISLHRIYENQEDFQSCLTLATQVAGDDKKLYDCFLASGRMKEYVRLLSKVSELDLLQKNSVFSL